MGFVIFPPGIDDSVNIGNAVKLDVVVLLEPVKQDYVSSTLIIEPTEYE